MREFPSGGLIGKSVSVVRKIGAMQIPLYAAYAAFFLLLSVFPALLLILNVLRHTAFAVDTLVAFLGDFLPKGLAEPLEELVYGVYQEAGRGVGLSAAAALWSASKGLYGLLRGLNAIYGVAEDRGFLHTRLISVFHTFLFLPVMTATLALHVFGSSLIQLLTMVDHPVVIFLVDRIDLRFFLLLILQSLVFTLMYTALPNRHNRFFDSLPGGLLAASGWQVFSDLYSRYMAYAQGGYGGAFGMLWLYGCMSILFYGGVLNRFLQKFEK